VRALKFALGCAQFEQSTDFVRGDMKIAWLKPSVLAGLALILTFGVAVDPSGASNLPKFGTIVKDGDFSFRPTHLVCNIMSVGSNSNYDLTRPTGQYCRITLWIYNHSRSSEMIDVTSQYAADKKSRQYPGDINADTAGNPNLNGGLGLDLTTLNPGLSVTGFVYFDMPKRDVPTYFTFHDSAFSNGVKERA